MAVESTSQPIVLEDDLAIIIVNLKTPAAIQKYKDLCQQGTKKVAALIHTTC